MASAGCEKLGKPKFGEKLGICFHFAVTLRVGQEWVKSYKLQKNREFHGDEHPFVRFMRFESCSCVEFD